MNLKLFDKKTGAIIDTTTRGLGIPIKYWDNFIEMFMKAIVISRAEYLHHYYNETCQYFTNSNA